ncbi:MAG: DUF983 domain-containing protein [Bacteroidota bacterium]
MLSAILQMRCPACRRAFLFKEPNTFRLRKLGAMHPYCPACGSSNKVEPGFYFGAAYVSYILMVGLLCGYVFVYYLFFGEIFSHFQRLMSGAIVLAVAITPWVFRYSRVLFLYLFVRYKGCVQVPGRKEHGS